MEKQVITINERYYCAYIPSARSQKYRFDEVTGPIKVTIPSLTSEEAPVAFRTGKGEIRWYNKQCWRKCIKNDFVSGEGGEGVTIDWSNFYLHVSLPYGHSRSRELCQKKYREAAKGYILVDGYLWRQCGEPRYVVNTFGLGHNHGGTGLFVEEYYNQNIPASNYFSALDGGKAVAYANKVAERRGDTNNVGKFEKMIEVLIPEAVTIRPEAEHGEGDPFINKLEAVTEAAPDATTAGLMALMVGMQEVNK